MMKASTTLASKQVRNLHVLMEQNMREAYQSCDNPQSVRERLLRKLDHDNYAVGLVLRNGWKTWMEAK